MARRAVPARRADKPDDQVSGPCGSSWEARGLSLWKATDQLLSRPVTIYLLPPGVPSRAPWPTRCSRPPRCPTRGWPPSTTPTSTSDCPYIVAEWTPGTHLEDLVLSGPCPPALPHPALAAAMIADAADAIAVAHRAGRPHLRLTPRSVRWDHGSGLKITGLGLDAALCGGHRRRTRWRPTPRRWPGCCTRCSPGTGPVTSPPRCRPRPGTRGRCARRARSAPGCPPCWTPSPTAACRAQAADAPLRPQTPAGLAMALRMVQRPSYQLERLESRARSSGPAASSGTAAARPGTPRRPAPAPHHAAAARGL